MLKLTLWPLSRIACITTCAYMQQQSKLALGQPPYPVPETLCMQHASKAPSNYNTVLSEPQVYKQKVKHLLYEHQNNITTLKADGELALKLQQDDFRGREVHLTKDKRNLKLELKEQVRQVLDDADG